MVLGGPPVLDRALRSSERLALRFGALYSFGPSSAPRYWERTRSSSLRSSPRRIATANGLGHPEDRLLMALHRIWIQEPGKRQIDNIILIKKSPIHLKNPIFTI